MTDEPRGDDVMGDLLIEEEMKDSYLTYAMSVIIQRALPDVRDGLKPSQRRVLLAMHDLGLGPRGKFRKCAKVCGDTSGNYHPHGEAVVYPTLVRMGQDFNMRYQLVDPQGNYGSVDGDPPAAMRYTECRMAAPATELLEDLEKDTVDFVANYDESRQEPTVLPGRFPNLLCNGASGIAVGMATSIPPHNLGEVVDALHLLIDDRDASLDDIMEVLPGPDFPTGAMICGRSAIRQAYETGRGRLAVRAEMHLEEAGKRGDKEQIVVTSLPYQLNKVHVIEKIADLVKDDRLPAVADLRDESDRDGMRIVIELKTGENPDITINRLYKHSQLQSTFSVIMIALVNGRPETLGIRSMLTEFLDHRFTVVRRRTQFLLDKARDRMEVVVGLILALDLIDEVIATIRASRSEDDARQALMEMFARRDVVEKFKAHRMGAVSSQAELLLDQAGGDGDALAEGMMSERQAAAILAMRLRRLTGLEREKLEGEYADLEERIAGYEALLADDDLVWDEIREDLHELKDKYADERRTRIDDEEVIEIDDESLISEEDMVVTLSHNGYIKRTPLSVYRAQRRGGKGVRGQATRDEDFLEHLWVASTHDYLLFFTNHGRVHWQKVYQLPQGGRTTRGRALVNVLQLEDEERCTSVVPVREFDDRYLLMATNHGYVKKTVLSAFSNVRKVGIKAINLGDGERLMDVLLTDGDDEVILATRNGMSIRFHEDDVRAMGRTAHGVIGIKMRDDDDEVVGMCRVREGGTILTICEKGYGKRSEFDEYRRQNRGGIGIINIKTVERNGPVAEVMSVLEDDAIVMISRNGQVVRTNVSEISIIGRATQGVRILGLDDDDVLASVARVEDEEDEGEESPSADAPAEAAGDAGGDAEDDGA